MEFHTKYNNFKANETHVKFNTHLKFFRQTIYIWEYLTTKDRQTDRHIDINIYKRVFEIPEYL